MKTQMEKTPSTPIEISVKIILDAWKRQNQQVDNFLDKVSDEQLRTEIATGKNTGIYLLGHMAAANDAMFTMFELGEKLYPHFEEVFLKNPENKKDESVSIAELKTAWIQINTKLSGHFAGLTPEDWFKKHVLVSDEDFVKEPHRNRLNVLLSRTNHQSYHFAQINTLLGK